MNWLAAFFSGSEREVDSLVVGCSVAVLTVLGFSVYVGLQDHATWNPLTVSTGVATIFGAAHGAKGFRDRNEEPKP